LIQIAQKLISDRDASRKTLLQIKEDVQKIYDRLNGDINAIQNRLNQPPPPTNDELRALVLQLAQHWDEKVRDINDTAESVLLALGCPRIVATNP
jgi:archaellum component FlaC